MTRIPERIELAAAVEANSVEACRTWGAWPKLRLHDDPDVIWTITDLPFPQFNTVLCARLPAEGTGAAVAAVLAPFRERRVPMAWWTGPNTTPGDLDFRLAEAGLVLTDDSLGMACRLDRLAALRGGLRSTTVIVEEVVTCDALRSWGAVLRDVFGFSSGAARHWTAMHEAAGYGAGRGWRHYVATQDGRVVGAASAFHGSEVAGIANVAVRPRARGRGAATEMMVRALEDARSAGFGTATLWSSLDGEPIYRRLGFETCCRGACWIDRGPDAVRR